MTTKLIHEKQKKSYSLKIINIVEKYSTKFVKTQSLKKKNSDQPISEELMAAGMLNVLSVGYKGVELWRQHRIPLEIELEAKDDEKEA